MNETNKEESELLKTFTEKAEKEPEESQEELTYSKLMNEWGDDEINNDPFEWLLKHFTIQRNKI